MLDARGITAARPAESRGARWAARLAAPAAFAAIAAATLYLSFNAGGFFVTAPALVTVAVLLALTVRVVVAERPFAGVGPAAAVAIGGMALFAVWTLLSGIWSDAPGRALVEFDRALLYAATLTLFASFPATPGRLRVLLGGLTFAIVVVAGIATITRVLPEVWPLRPNVAQDRLSYPLTYWNALGLLAGVGLVGALHFAASVRERAAVRVLASMAVPLLACTLYFTLSRGSIAVTVAAVALYLLLARTRGTLSAAIATLPASAAAVLVAYGAGELTSEDPTSALAVDQGHRVALVLAGAMLAAGLLRWALLALDRRLAQARLPRSPVNPWALLGVLAALVVGGLLVSGLPQRAIEDFGDSAAVSNLDDERSRLTSVSNNGRFDHWRVALDAFAEDPLTGHGAGTYQHLWAQHRESDFTVINAHSLYLGVLGELGLVGLALLLTALVAIVVAFARRVRGPERAVAAAGLALAAMWAVHAGVDWDWEMPAVTLWLFVLGGAALALPPAPAGAEATAAASAGFARRPTLRLVAGICCLVVAVTPALLALSQRQLDAASKAFAAGDCERAIDRGLASISILGSRPQPYALVGLCDVRLGADELGVRMLEQAVERDPDDWEYHYVLALARAAAGQDPRADARRAVQLNPLDERARYGLRLYGRGDPRGWRKRALAAPLPW